MPVDILEGIELAVAGRHELDDAHRGVTCEPRGFLELAPAAVICLDFARQLFDEARNTLSRHQLLQPGRSDVIDHDLPLESPVLAGSFPAGPGLEDLVSRAAVPKKSQPI